MKERMDITAARQMDVAKELEKLDKFAGMAMQALLISRPDDTFDVIAEMAYNAAVDMLDERDIYLEAFRNGTGG